MPSGDDYGRREALYAGERPVINEAEQRRARQASRKRSRGARWLARLSAMAVLALFGGIVWYAYSWGVGEVGEGQIPIVRASEGPEKTLPDERGGLEVPYQDSLVLNGSDEGVERIVPPPEEPLPLEAMPEPAAAPETAEAQAEDQTPAPSEDPIGQMIQTAELDGGGREAVAEADPLPEVKPEAPEASSEAAQEPTPEPTPEPGVTQQAQVGQVSGYKVQLAAVQDASAAEREWRRLQGLHPELLGNLTLFTETVEIEGRGTFHRIQAGPLPSRETAADLCDVLKGREQPCLVVSP